MFSTNDEDISEKNTKEQINNEPQDTTNNTQAVKADEKTSDENQNDVNTKTKETPKDTTSPPPDPHGTIPSTIGEKL